MKNSFGNYVIQKALKLAIGYNKVKLTNHIKKQYGKLTDKKSMSKWKAILDLITNDNLMIQSNFQHKNTDALNNSMNSNHSASSNHSHNSNRSANPGLTKKNINHQLSPTVNNSFNPEPNMRRFFQMGQGMYNSSNNSPHMMPQPMLFSNFNPNFRNYSSNQDLKY